MGTKTVKFSDLSGQLVEDEDEIGRLIVRDHPDFADAIALDVLPDDLGDLAEETDRFVSLEYFAPGETQSHRFVVRLDDFSALAKAKDMQTLLENALLEQHRQERQPAAGRFRRRGPRRADTEEPRERIDYSSPEHAGTPHRGRVTEAEREYVRAHLDEVNTRLQAQGLRTIDPADPKMQQRYGLSADHAA